MFDFLKKNKEYISCEWLEYGINFTMTGISHCGMCARENSNDIPSAPLLKGDKYDFATFWKKKKEVRKNARKGIVDKRCTGCFVLKKQIWDKKFQIKNIGINTHTRCNSDCIYCYTHQNKPYWNKRPDILVFDFLNNGFKSGLISKDCNVLFGGGEPVLFKDFEKSLNLLIDNSIPYIRIHSSGIQYSPAIERALSFDCLNLVISPDAGDKELYKKIKCVDKFDECWENISKYAKAQNNKKDQLNVKYIIIPDVNDTVEDIKVFVDKTLESGARHILIDIEMEWYKRNNKQVEKVKELFELIKFAERYAEKQGLTWSHFPTVCCAITDYHKMYDDTAVEI